MTLRVRLAPRARILARPITCETLKCMVLPVAMRGINEASFYATENIDSESRKDGLTCQSKTTEYGSPRDTINSVDQLITEAASLYCYANFKDEQEEVLKSFVEGKDVFVSLPTGYGKSLCYALLPAIFNVKKGLRKHPSQGCPQKKKVERYSAMSCSAFTCSITVLVKISSNSNFS